MSATSPARARVAANDGFTLIELLVSMTIGIVILGAAYTILERSSEASARVAVRVAAVQEGRLGMEQITRQLRSQVCLGPTEPAIAETSANALTFYADLGSAGVPERRRIVYEPDARRLVELVYAAQGSGPPWTFATAPTTSRVIASDVVPAPGAPVFAYYGYTNTAPPRATMSLGGSSGGVLSADERARAVRIVVTFGVRPRRGPNDDSAGEAVLQDEVFARTAELMPGGRPRCG